MALHRTVEIFWSLMVTYLKTASAVLKATSLKIFYKRNIRIVSFIVLIFCCTIQ